MHRANFQDSPKFCLLDFPNVLVVFGIEIVKLHLLSEVLPEALATKQFEGWSLRYLLPV